MKLKAMQTASFGMRGSVVLGILLASMVLAGCQSPPAPARQAAAPSTPAPERTARAAEGAGAQANDTPVPKGPGVVQATSVYDYLQEPDAAAGGYHAQEVCQKLVDPAPPQRDNATTALRVELAFTRYAAAAGVENAEFVVASGDQPRNRTSVPDSRGVLAVTLTSQDWMSDLWVCLYPNQDLTVMAPAQDKVYVTTFAGGMPPAGFTAVP
jgi:hypothetical protein